ncbi:MAG: hypothetical protein PHQ74_04045 [Crocinitomicaceae bacterium]|nr:hypothetical protein [Crocinitomicaceae bacterium]
METKLDIQKLYFDLKKKKVKKIKSFDSGLVSLGIQTDIKIETTTHKKAQPKKAELAKEKLAE